MSGTSREVLTEHVGNVVDEIQRGFTESDDDWNPVAIVSHEDGLIIVPLDVEKSKWGTVLRVAAELVQANAIAVVISTWQLAIKPDDPELKEKLARAKEIGVSNMEDRYEALLVTGIDQSGVMVKSATIHRHDDSPPTLGEYSDWINGVDSHIFKPVIEYFTQSTEEGNE